MTNKNPIVICGTGRAGTSVVAGMLFYLDVLMGEEFVPADINNPTGHWEDKAFTELGRDRARGKYNKEDFKELVKTIIQTRIDKAEQQNRRWGWKIPITTNLLPEYKEIFNEMGLTPEYLIPFRHPDAVAESCVNAYNMSQADAQHLAYSRIKMLYDTELVKDGESETIESNGDNVWVLPFEQIVNDPADTVEQLKQRYGIKGDEHSEWQAKYGIVNDAEQNARIMVVVPNMAWIHARLAHILISTIGKMKCDQFSINTSVINIAPVDFARNTAVQTFLDSPVNFTHLLMIDTDTVPPMHAIKSMLKANRPIVTGVTKTQKPDSETGEIHPTPMVFVRNDYEDADSEVQDGYGLTNIAYGFGVQPIDVAGASCLMVKREVFENMEEPYFKMEYDEKGRRKRGEDFYFCYKAQQAGYQIYADFNVHCTHYKLAAI